MLPRIAIGLLMVGLVSGPLPSHLRAWSPLLELGDRGEALPSAIVKVASLTKLAEAVTHNLEIDDSTQALFESVTKNMSTLDPDAMYRLLGAPRAHRTSVGVGPGGPRPVPTERPERSERPEDSRRAMTVFGELSTKGDYRVIGERASRPARFGDLAVEIAMKPAKPDTYLLETDVTAHLEVTADELTGVARKSMDWIQDTAELHRAGAQDGLDEADRAVGQGLATAFPAMVALADRYFEPLDGVARAPGGVRGRLIGRFKADGFAKDYPKLGKLLTEEVKTKARARVTSMDGRTLAIFKIGGNGQVALIFEVDPNRWTTDRYRVEADVAAEMFGMEIVVSGIEVQTSVVKTDRAITLRSIYNRTPKIAIGGAALGIVPIAVVDAIIPSNVQAIVESFLAGLAHTDDQRGARLEVTLPEDRSLPLRFTSRAELLNNGFVSFWLQIASSEIFGNEKVLEEMQLLQERCLAAFSSDFARFQDQAL